MKKTVEKDAKPKITKTSEKSKAISTVKAIPNEDKKISEQTSEQIMKEIIRLLNDIYNKIEILTNDNNTSLGKMNLTDLYSLSNMLNKNFTKNNYYGGNEELKISTNNLIIKIEEEINNRIKLLSNV